MSSVASRPQFRIVTLLRPFTSMPQLALLLGPQLLATLA
jgi:hypothetical protein